MWKQKNEDFKCNLNILQNIVFENKENAKFSTLVSYQINETASNLSTILNCDPTKHYFWIPLHLMISADLKYIKFGKKWSLLPEISGHT